MQEEVSGWQNQTSCWKNWGGMQGFLMQEGQRELLPQGPCPSWPCGGATRASWGSSATRTAQLLGFGPGSCAPLPACTSTATGHALASATSHLKSEETEPTCGVRWEVREPGRAPSAIKHSALLPLPPCCPAKATRVPWTREQPGLLYICRLLRALGGLHWIQLPWDSEFQAGTGQGGAGQGQPHKQPCALAPWRTCTAASPGTGTWAAPP